MPNPQPGTILGAYRVEGTIGSGSMGDVFGGVDTGLNRKVAIKILSEKHRDSAELRARFVREGRAVAAISHPNVVQVFATGTFDERPYIAMELLTGTDLGSQVENNGPLDSSTAALAIFDAAQGLMAASQAGLIHRDVKPSNLVRLASGRVKVTDFGLAKPVDPGSEPALTAMGVVVGTPDYIAPEQARGETIDERVDLYALGGSLYFMLTGIPPFRTGRPADDKYLKVVARHLRNPPPDAHQNRPGVDKELSDLARHMMAKKPDERPSYDEVIDRITHILERIDPNGAPMLASGRDRSRPIVIPADSSMQQRAVKPSSPNEDIAPPRRSAFPGWLLAVTLVCVGLFTAGLTVLLRKPDASAGTKTPEPSTGSAGSAGSGVIVTVDAAVTPAAPAGMVLVKKPDGTPWFFADAAPVSSAAFTRVFAKHTQSGAAEGPVVNVSYADARSYVKTRDGRLLTAAELEAALATPGITSAGNLFEWVASPDEKKLTVRQGAKSQTRPDQKQRDVTFRVGRDL
ncbi:MAG: protein kinase [Kofleriaceae bacterium]